MALVEQDNWWKIADFCLLKNWEDYPKDEEAAVYIKTNWNSSINNLFPLSFSLDLK